MFQSVKFQTSPPPISSPLEGESKGGGNLNANIDDEISWTFFPARDSLRKTVLASAIIVFFLVLILIFYGLFWFILSAIFLFGSLNAFFLPTHYKLEADTLQIKKAFYTNTRRWSEFRKHYLGKNGILLSPFDKPTFLNNFRGIYLYFPPQLEMKEKIIKFVDEKLSPKE